MEKYYYWLHNVSGIGRITFNKIVTHMTPEELYQGNTEKIKELLTKKQIENIKRSKEIWDVQKQWELLKKRNINLFYNGGRGYPEKLSVISDAPPVLYQKGRTEILHQPSVAVIGARSCSNYGSFMAKELGRELARIGIVVVSGMARGIDSICQRTSLEYGGESIGVLGSGVEICYPPEERQLFEGLQKKGCLVSENPPFTQPQSGLFPLRNRIISALADVIVVVEAREKSGTLITVDMALEQGKEVYAIPGRTTDWVSRGCNKLIKQGAGVLLSVEEFLEEISPILKVKYDRGITESIGKLSSEEKKIVEVLDTTLKNMEEIYELVKQKNTEISLPQVMNLVMDLRMKKIIEEENGYYFCDKIAVATKTLQ